MIEETMRCIDSSISESDNSKICINILLTKKTNLNQ